MNNGGYIFSVLDEDDFPLYALDQPLVVTTDFVTGLVRESINAFPISGLTTDAYTELEAVVRMAVEADRVIGILDEDDFPLATYTDTAGISVDAPVDTSADDWTIDPHVTATSFSGATSTQTPGEDGKAYFAGIPYGAALPSHNNLKAGRQSDGITPVLGILAKNENVTDGVSFELTVANILYDENNVRYTRFTGVVGFEDSVGNPLGVFNLGTIDIDGPASFAGVVSGTVDNATHKVTLNFGTATDQFDDSSEISFIAGYNQGSGDVIAVQSLPGVASITFDPLINGTANFFVRSINTRGLIDTNSVYIPLALTAGQGTYTVVTGILQSSGSPLRNTDIEWIWEEVADFGNDQIRAEAQWKPGTTDANGQLQFNLISNAVGNWEVRGPNGETFKRKNVTPV